MRHRRHRRRSKSFLGKTLTPLALLAALWVAGFFVYLGQIPHGQAPPEDGSKADAIVVLTGGGGRLEMGLRLLARGHATKLFISGVDRGVDKAELLKGRRIDVTMLDCCIALGYSADDTFGNALESSRWMNAEGFTSLYLVTANYHMPRSLVEFRTALPRTDLMPRAVDPANVHLDDWWRWPGTIQLLVVEYTKYIATLGRILLMR